MILVASTPAAKVAAGEPPVGPPPFEAFTETDVTYTNQPIPAGNGGVWVTLIGSGAKGGTGAVGGTGVRKGGAGGAGGSKVGRVFIPATDLGPTYTVRQGTNGAASTFQSGSVSLSAGTGTSHSATGVSNCPMYAGGLPGQPASTGSGNGDAGKSGTSGSGAGGGAGAGFNSNDNAGNPGNGGVGTSGGGSGGKGGAATTGGKSSSGVAGVAPGGGGGGGGAVNSTSSGAVGGPGGAGGAGRVVLEWVAPAPTAPPEFHEPELTQFTTAGAWSYTVPDWADRVDVILLGGGAGGGGGVAGNMDGDGGGAGQWATRTLVKGTDFTSAVLSGVVGGGGVRGPDGAPSPPFNHAGPGGSSTCDQAGMTAAGGEARTEQPRYGFSPGNVVFNGETYHGGAQQNAYSQPGIAPGGGGNGGEGGLLLGKAGSVGAPGAVWIRAWSTATARQQATGTGTGTGGTEPSTIIGSPHDDETSHFMVAGAWNYHIPEWCNRLDVVMVGGGAGASGGAAATFGGAGGQPGHWHGQTLIRGVDLTVDVDTLSGVVGGGGNHGNGSTTSLASDFWGHDGSASTCTQSAASAGGGHAIAGSFEYLGDTHDGIGAGQFVFNGTTYRGGADATTRGQAGNPPGGGGSGGAGHLTHGDDGGSGAAGEVWIRAWYSTADISALAAGGGIGGTYYPSGTQPPAPAVTPVSPGTGTGTQTPPDTGTGTVVTPPATPFFSTPFDDPSQPDWRHKAGAAPTIRGGGFCSLQPATETVAECLHVPDGDDVEVTFQISALHEGDAVFFRSSDTHTMYLIVTTSGGRSEFDLYTHTAWDIGNPNGSASIKPRGTKRASFPWTGPPPIWGTGGAPVVVTAVGSLYTVTVNNEPAITWDDAAGVHPVGATQRKCGIATKQGSPGILAYSLTNL